MTTKRPEIDMSTEAVSSRLEVVRALYKLMLSLRTIESSKGRRAQDAPGTPASDQ